jgi:hypothetical protein
MKSAVCDLVGVRGSRTSRLMPDSSGDVNQYRSGIANRDLEDLIVPVTVGPFSVWVSPEPISGQMNPPQKCELGPAFNVPAQLSALHRV